MTRLMRSAAGPALALLLAFGVSACDSFLDVNEDPNNPESVQVDLMLPGMLIAFGHDIIGPTDIRYGNLTGPVGWGSEWLQQWSDNRTEHTYEQHQWFQIANQGTDQFWGDSYADVMQEARNIMEAAEDRPSMHGIAKLVFAWNAALLTDAFGPMPFSEAFDPSIRNPTYDTQPQVYAEVFRLIDEAIAEMQQGTGAPGTSDVVHQGDMARWVQLAYSVKAKHHLRIAYAPDESPQEHAQAALDALAQGIQSPADAPVIEYAGGQGNRQPWYLFEDQRPDERSRTSQFFLNWLLDRDDPRLPIMVEPAGLVCPEGTNYERADCTVATEVVYRGNRSGGPGEPDSAISAIGEFFSQDSTDHVWFPYEDTKWIEAESRLILSGAGAADAPYREAIRANMERLGVPQGEIDAYLAAQPSLGSVANPLQEIIEEKYVANFLRGDEVWADYRRTGYPVVPLPVPPAGEQLYLSEIPRRLRTPAAEMQFNSESLAATGISTGQEGMLVDVWWASGSPSF